MVKAKENCVIYYNGVNSTLIKGTLYKETSPIVKSNSDKFEKVQVKVPNTSKKAKTIIEPKKELLVEEPVSELKTEVEKEESVESIENVEPTETEEKKPRRRRKTTK